MNSIWFDIDLEITRIEGRCARTWTLSLDQRVLARHETLRAAIAVAKYLADVKLRARGGRGIAFLSFPLPNGGRSEVCIATARTRAPPPVGAGQGAVVAEPSRTT